MRVAVNFLRHLKTYLGIGRAIEFHRLCQFGLMGSGYWRALLRRILDHSR